MESDGRFEFESNLEASQIPIVKCKAIPRKFSSRVLHHPNSVAWSVVIVNENSTAKMIVCAAGVQRRAGAACCLSRQTSRSASCCVCSSLCLCLFLSIFSSNLQLSASFELQVSS